MSAINSIITHRKLFGLRGIYRRAMLPMGGDRHFTIRTDVGTLTLRLGTTDVAAYEQVIVGREYGFPLPLQPKTIIDGGANIGLTSRFLAHRFPNARIVAVEPDRSNFDILCRNTISNVTPIHAALWGKDSFVDVDESQTHWGRRVQQGSKVRAVSIPTLMEEVGIDHIDLLKLDVEGAEVEIFQSSENWIENVSVVAVELHDRFRSGCQEAFDFATKPFGRHWKTGELTIATRI